MMVSVANRVDQAFARSRAQGRVAVAPYVMVGYPERGSTLELVPALEEAGAALVELGMPFSDPLADGATIQRASARALAQGVTVGLCLESVAALRARGVGLPLLLMGYMNPVLQYGPARFCAEAAQAGADGLIVPDLPPEEGAELARSCAERGLHLVYLAAPTSSEERLATIGARSAGFVYCVSIAGVTGARARLPEQLPSFLARVRSHTSLPLAVGFGISSRAHVEALQGQAEAAIVASALLDVIEQTPAGQQVQQAARFIAGLVRG